MQQIITFRNDILIKIAVITGVVALSGFALNQPAIAKGFFLGSAVSGLLFFIKVKKLMKAMASEEVKLISRTVSDFLLRYLLMFAALAVAFTNPEVNFIATAAGLLTLQGVIIFNEVCLAKIKNRRGL